MVVLYSVLLTCVGHIAIVAPFRCGSIRIYPYILVSLPVCELDSRVPLIGIAGMSLAQGIQQVCLNISTPIRRWYFSML